MKGIDIVAVVIVWAVGLSDAAGEDRYFWYSVTADKKLYQLGERVHWKTWAGVVGRSDVTGIASFDCTLHESRPEAMSGPLKAYFAVPGHWIVNCLPENYYEIPGVTNKVKTVFNYGNNYRSDGSSRGANSVNLSASQFARKEGTFGGEFAESSYPVTRTGFHTLYFTHGTGTVWLAGKKDAVEVDAAQSYDDAFYVTGGLLPPSGAVDTAALSEVCSSVGRSDCNETNGFADGADVNRDGRVDGLDVQVLFDAAGAEIDVAADVYVGADLTGDDRLDLCDYAIFAAHWRETGATRADLWNYGTDFDRSGAVDAADLLAFARQWRDHLRPSTDRNAP